MGGTIRETASLVIQHTHTDDPFCKIRVGKKNVKTSFKQSTLNPVWNETFTFDNVELTDELKVAVVDHVTFGQGYVYGESIIPLSSITKNGTSDQWVQLFSNNVNKKASILPQSVGIVYLLFNFNPMPETSSSSNSSTQASSGNASPQNSHDVFNISSSVDISDSKKDDESGLPVLFPSSTTEAKMPTDQSSFLTQSSSSSSHSSVIMNSSSGVGVTGVDPATFKKEKEMEEIIKKFSLTKDDKLVKIFSGALSNNNILLRGRLYVFEKYVCFYANIFGIETMVIIYFII
jgi:hypothetical protein